MKDIGAPQSATALAAISHTGGGGLALATAVAPTATAAATASSSTSSSGHTNGILQLGDMGTPGDVAAELDILHTANRDMFSWLLFNSENLTASGGGIADDPFRMLTGHDDDAAPGSTGSGLPLSFLPHAHDPLDSDNHPTATTATALTGNAVPSHATASASSLQPTAGSGAGADKAVAVMAMAAAAAKKRGKKRPNDALVDAPRGTLSTTVGTVGSAAAVGPTPPAPKKHVTGKENLNGTPMSATQEGLLRHLESANNALAQKRQQSTGGVSASTASFSTGGSTPKSERASSSGSDDTLTSLQRKQKLERNRESARECRRRKREHILGVEERCRQLERENMELRGQLKAGKEAMKLEEKEKNRVCEELEQMIQRGASEKELAEKIDNFKEQYSDYGHGRRSALSYHLHQIERLLLPTQVTKMCIWALRQDDSFWQDEEDETSLPVILAKELGLSEEQKKKIQQQRGSISLICQNLKSALSLLDELKTEVIQKNTTLDMEMEKLQNILTPTQRAKFIVWVTNNQACMHLLNKLWRSVL